MIKYHQRKSFEVHTDKLSCISIIHGAVPHKPLRKVQSIYPKFHSGDHVLDSERYAAELVPKFCKQLFVALAAVHDFGPHTLLDELDELVSSLDPILLLHYPLRHVLCAF